jgi:hypothetical protein
MQLAECLGLEVRQIRNLEKQGVVQHLRRRGTTKLYSLGSSVQRYIAWHTSAAEEQSPKARIERANADEAEARAEMSRLKLAQLREALVDPERAHQRMRAALNVIAAQVLQLSGQAAVDLLHLEDTLAVEQALQPHLDRIIRDAGQALIGHLDAEDEDDDDASSERTEDDEDDDAAG